MSERPQNKNLIPAKPGERRNPSGRPKTPPELRAYNEMDVRIISRMITKYGNMSTDELQKLSKDGSTKGIDRNVILNILDKDKLPLILDRTVGKLVDKVEQTNIDYNADEHTEIERGTVRDILKAIK